MLVQVTLSDEVIKKKSRVKCEICGKEFEWITAAHIKTHGITYNEYKEQFPDALLMSDGCKQKIRDNQPDRSGEKNGMSGKHLTEDHKQKIGKGHLGKPLTELHKQHIRDNRPDNSREKNGNYGKKHPGMNAGEKSGMYEKGYLVAGEKNGNYGKKHPGLNAGDKHWNWHDGISFGSYCEKFNTDFKERVRDFFDRKCYVCGKSEQEQIDEMIKDGKKTI